MKPIYRIFLSIVALAVLAYGLITGNIIQSLEQTPYSTGFIIVVMLLYIVVSVVRYLKDRKK